MLITLCTAHAELPKDFLYQGNPIPEHHLAEFFSDATICQPNQFGPLDLSQCKGPQKQNDPEEYAPSIDREWSYIGPVGDDLHLVWGYYWESGCMGKFTALLLVKRESSKLVISDFLFGGDRHASMIHGHGTEIKGTTITYSRAITSLGFVSLAAKLHPDFCPFYERSSKHGLCIGEGCFWGSCIFRVNVSSDGKFSKPDFISFTSSRRG